LGQIILEAPDTPEIRIRLLNATLFSAQNFSNASRILNEAESSDQGPIINTKAYFEQPKT